MEATRDMPRLRERRRIQNFLRPIKPAKQIVLAALVRRLRFLFLVTLKFECGSAFNTERMCDHQGQEIKCLSGFQVKPLKRVTASFVESEKVFLDRKPAISDVQHLVHVGDPLLLQRKAFEGKNLGNQLGRFYRSGFRY